jgi:DNA modification methylase
MSTVQLHLGDCLEFMRGMDAGSVDAVVTDPPYGVNFEYATYQDSKTSLIILKNNFVIEAKRIAKRIAVFTGVMNVGLYHDADWMYSWVVPAGTGVSAWGFCCHTPIAFYGKDAYSGKGSRPDVFIDYKPKREGSDHPCEKPLSVMRWAIERFTLPGETVIDCFMGSGTTGVACVQTGRNFIGCEIDPGYFEIAKQRIARAQQQPRLEGI